MSYCKDCIHYKVCGNEGVDDSAMTFCADKQKDGDLISRKAAIDIVVFECGKWTGLAKEISKQLKQLPSADNTAEWVLKEGIYGVAYCSKCDYELRTNDTNYCPNCGRRMKKESEEEE